MPGDALLRTWVRFPAPPPGLDIYPNYLILVLLFIKLDLQTLAKIKATLSVKRIYVTYLPH